MFMPEYLISQVPRGIPTTNFAYSEQTKNANFCKPLEGIFKGKQKYKNEMAASCCVDLRKFENLLS